MRTALTAAALLATIALAGCGDRVAIDTVDPRTGCHWIVHGDMPSDLTSGKRMDAFPQVLNGKQVCDRDPLERGSSPKG